MEKGKTFSVWGYSSAGRAPALQAGGQRFDPVYLHQRGALAGMTMGHQTVLRRLGPRPDGRQYDAVFK